MKRVGDLVPTVPKFEACEQCKDTPGWVKVMRPWGTMQVESQARCRCYQIHLEKVRQQVDAMTTAQRRDRKTRWRTHYKKRR